MAAPHGDIQRLLVIGATGDLTGRYLLPALASLNAAGHLAGSFQLLAAAREDWDQARFREHATGWLAREAAGLPAHAVEAVLSHSRYRRIDLGDPDSVRACVAGEGPVAAYLALPPAIFPAAVTALQQAGLPEGSRVVLEKPFGEDLASARELNRLLLGLMDEREIFRVDHFLAMSTVQSVLGTRLANRVLEPIWSSAHIAEVEIIWEESLALENRAVYYDGVGALKDMVQNHLLQVLCLVAMEPPMTLGERDLRDRKVDVLRSIRPLTEQQAIAQTRRARYGAGTIGGHRIPAYLDEDGVDPEHRTETFAEVVLELDNWRWSGTAFRLRTGKALAADRKDVVIHFREVPHLPLEGASAPPNRLHFGLEPEGLRFELAGIGRGRPIELVPLALHAELEPPELPAYGRLLLAVLHGEAALSIRGDEAEESWRVVTPVLEAWADGAVPLEEYPAGSAGPR